MDDRFSHRRYLVRRKIFKLLGEAFHIYDEAGNVVLYSKQKAFRLREDIRLYDNESMDTELVTIAARNIIDFGAAYEVVDAVTGDRLGTFKRKGFSSILRDSWIVMDAEGNDIGSIQEDNMALALFRRFASSLVPQTFAVQVHGQPVCTYSQRFNPFIFKIDVVLGPADAPAFNARMAIAGAVLLCAIEQRQD